MKRDTGAERRAVTVTGRMETTLFLDPLEFRGMNDLDAIVAIQRELGPGNWNEEEVVDAANLLRT